MTSPRSLISTAAALVTAVTLIACAGSPRDTNATAAAPAPAPPAPAPAPLPAFDPAHPPVARGGPDGRSALDGEWVERLDPSAHGEALGWADGGFTGRTVQIPYSPNAGTVRGDAGMRSYNGSVAWYRTTFTVAAAGEYALRFESVNHRVTIRPLGATELDGPDVVTRLSGGGATVAVSVYVRNRAVDPRTVQVEGVLGGQRLSFASVRLRAGEEQRVRAVARVQQPDLWAPGHPALTDLHVFVAGESGWTERVGLRELRWSGGGLRLNGAPLRLHGASMHEDAEGPRDALLPGDMDAIVQRLQAIGANTTREQHAVDPALLERLDAAGILVWQEVGPVDAPGNWTSDTPAERRRAIERVRTSERQTAVHPSILTWSLGNEVSHDGHPGGQAEFVDHASRLLHELDPGRPTTVDVWGSALPFSSQTLLYRDLDMIGVTMYEGWYQRPGEPAGAIGPNVRRRLAQVHRIFAGRPLVVSEFGAEANTLNRAGSPGSDAFQARVLDRNIRAFRSDRALDGWLVWTLQDFAVIPTFQGGSIRQALPSLRLVRGVNQKGLFTYAGTPKPASFAVVRRLS